MNACHRCSNFWHLRPICNDKIYTKPTKYFQYKTWWNTNEILHNFQIQMNTAFYLYHSENVDLWNLADPFFFSLSAFFYDNAILQSAFLNGIKTILSFWGQQKEGTPLQSACMLMVGMELWKTLQPMITCKITFVLLRSVASNLNVTKCNIFVLGKMMAENSWHWWFLL